MNVRLIQFAITFGALLVALVHTYAPGLAVDGTTVSLLATVSAETQLKLRKDRDVVFSGEIGVFMNRASLGITKMIYVSPDWPTSLARLNALPRTAGVTLNSIR